MKEEQNSKQKNKISELRLDISNTIRINSLEFHNRQKLIGEESKLTIVSYKK